MRHLNVMVCFTMVSLLPLGTAIASQDAEPVTFEAADLSEAHAPDLEEEMKSMESLLHWAIGSSAFTRTTL